MGLIAVLFVVNAHALGLGDIQVSSYLGEPLRGRIALAEVGDADLREMKVRLASVEDYSKNGLIYPDGIKFRMQLVNEAGAAPFIRVSTQQRLDELFVSLLVEISSPSGKIVKAYTFLLDPSPDPVLPVAVTSAVITAVPDSKPVTVTKQDSPPRAESGEKSAAVKPKSKRKKRVPTVAPVIGEIIETGQETKYHTDEQGNRVGTLSLTLSTALTISRNDPSAPGGVPQSADALQEELIAREKTLEELNAQIAEMQVLIGVLQAKLGVASASGVSPVMEADTQEEEASSAPEETAVLEVDAPVVAKASESGWKKPTMVAVLLLSGIAGLLWYRKRRGASQYGMFDDLDAVPEQPVVPQAVPAPMSEISIKTPAYVDPPKTEQLLPAEYEYLEEADIYLRFGHDKLAEEVLRDAIKINPNNPNSYLTLLRVFVMREDPVAFEPVAKHVKSMGDDSAWKQAAEMGHKLDPHNPLYQ